MTSLPPADHAQRITRRTFLATGLTLAATGAVIAATGSGLQQAHDYGTHQATLTLPKLRTPLRIAFLSDLHYGPWIDQRHVSAWVHDTRLHEPDLVLIGGDLVDRRASLRNVGPLLDALTPLQAPLGTYAVWGNHDHVALPGAARQHFANDLDAIGITLLHNHGRLLRPDLYLAGVDDLLQGKPDLRAALRDQPPHAATLLLDHNPDLLPQVAHHRVDLTLAGHTHGGQVVLPLLGPPFTSSRHGRRFLAGWIAAPTRAYVSRGLGVSHLPIRWNCPPELLILDLQPSA